jgi:tetratricopeptide (TPR) repeat protein
VYQETGRFFKAEAVYRQALHIREKALGSNDLNIARSYNDLALELLKQQKFQDAEDIFKRSLKGYEESV